MIDQKLLFHPPMPLEIRTFHPPIPLEETHAMSILCLLHHLLQSIAQILNRFPFRRSLSTRSTLCMASVCDGERQNRRLWLLWKTKNYARRNSDPCQIRPWL